MTVAELRLRMSAAEYLEWGRFLSWRAREEHWQRQRASQGRSPARGQAQRRRPPGAGGR